MYEAERSASAGKDNVLWRSRETADVETPGPQISKSCHNKIISSLDDVEVDVKICDGLIPSMP